MFTLVPDENSIEDPLCNSSFGSMVSLDYVTPDTGYEPKDMELADTNERNLATSSDIYFQDTLDDTASFPNVPDVDGDELAEFLAVVVDRTGQPVEVRSNSDQFSCDIQNLKSAQSQFPLVTQPKRMINQTGGSVEERIAEERESSNAQIRTMLDEQRRTIIAEYGEKVLHHELLAAQAEQNRRILQEELLRRQQDFREVHQQDLMKQKELQKFQNSTFDEFAQQKFIEDQKIIMELSGRLQELQNEVNCMNDSKDFRDAESICSGNSHVTSPPGLFPKHPPFEGLLKPAFISQRQTEEPHIRDTSGISGNVFAHPQTSSSAPYPQELNSTWRKTIEEPIHMSTAEKSGRPERDPDLRCQSGPSAKDSVIFSGGDSSKNYGADQQRLQISDLHFDKFPTPATFACWKIRFKTEVCTCSQFPTEAMQWIKEVELVDSVDDLRSSSSTRGISMPNFEVLDARIASALNKIIHNSHFKRKISLEEQKAQQEDRFLRGRQIAYLIYEQFRVTGTHRGCSSLANSTSAGRSRNWPKSKLAEVELAELEKSWPKSKLAEVDRAPKKNTRGQGMMPVLPNHMRIFQVGSMFSVLPASLISSTYIGENKPLVRLTKNIPSLELFPKRRIEVHDTFATCSFQHSTTLDLTST